MAEASQSDPPRVAGAAVLAARIVAIAGAIAWGFFFYGLIAAAALVATAGTLALLARQPLWPSRFWSLRGIDVLLAVLVIVAAAGAVLYAVDMIQAARTGHPDDETWWLAHLPMQAAFGLAVMASAALSMLGEVERKPGWRVLAGVTALSAVWLGAVSVAYPEHIGSLGTYFGVAAVIWGLLFAATGQLHVTSRLIGRR